MRPSLEVALRVAFDAASEAAEDGDDGFARIAAMAVGLLLEAEERPELLARVEAATEGLVDWLEGTVCAEE